MVHIIGEEPDPAKRIRLRQGEKIRSTRKLRDMTVEEMAEAVDVTPGAIRHWETGRYSPRAHHQLAIAKVFGVPHGVLFGLDAA